MGASSGWMQAAMAAAMIGGTAAAIAGTGGAAALPLAAGLGAGTGGTAFGVGAGITATQAVAGTAALGGGLAAGGQVMEGYANADAARYQAEIAKNNQQAAAWAAQDAEKRGAIAEKNYRDEARLERGKARANAAARGVQVDSGSALGQQVDLRAAGELDALMIRSNAQREAYGFNNQASDFSAERSLLRSKAKNDKAAGYMAGFGTLLTTGGTVADRWYR